MNGVATYLRLPAASRASFLVLTLFPRRSSSYFKSRQSCLVASESKRNVKSSASRGWFWLVSDIRLASAYVCRGVPQSSPGRQAHGAKHGSSVSDATEPT
eukprot:scaffold265593_cov31-Tisochrysis_lutea.AAC.1